MFVSAVSLRNVLEWFTHALPKISDVFKTVSFPTSGSQLCLRQREVKMSEPSDYMPSESRDFPIQASHNFINDDDEVHSINQQQNHPMEGMETEQISPSPIDFDGLVTEPMEWGESNQDDYGYEDVSVTQIPGGGLIRVWKLTSSTNRNPELSFDVIDTRYLIIHNLGTILNFKTAEEAIDNIFAQITEPALTPDVKTNDRVSMTIESESLKYPIYINMTRQNFESKRAFEQILNVTQSGDKLLLSGRFDVTISILRGRTGGKETTCQRPAHIQTWIRESKSLFQVRQNDNSCGHVGIFLGNLHNEALLNKWNDSRRKLWNAAKHTKNGKMHDSILSRAEELTVSSGVDFCSEMVVPGDVEQYASRLGKRIVVYHRSFDQLGCQSRIEYTTREPQQENEDETEIHQIFIERETFPDGANHYNVITKPNGYLSSNKKRYTSYCNNCYQPYNTNHKCEAKCVKCTGKVHDNTLTPLKIIHCESCYRDFDSEECFNNHVHKYCSNICSICKLARSPGHVCLQYKCFNCEETYTDSPHYCYLKPVDENKSSWKRDKNIIFVFWDTESVFRKTTNEELENSFEQNHIPVLVKAMTCCSQCINVANIKRGESVKTQDPCSSCGGLEDTFRGSTCIADFVDFLFVDNTERLSIATRASRSKSSVRCFAHNFRGYDGRFILREFFSREWNPALIISHNRILRIDASRIRQKESFWMLDSLSFLTSPLSKLPKAFDFAEIVRKGFFPYHFATLDNLNYRGEIPPLKFYGYEEKTEGERQELMTWYNQVDHSQTFVLQEEMEKYCRDDVLILMNAVLLFRDQFIKDIHVDPFIRCFTLASLAMYVFRCKHLKEKTIAVNPGFPYHAINAARSMESQVWLDWIQFSQNVTLRREQRHGKYNSDGYDNVNHVIYEYNGCYVHGCDKHFPDDAKQAYQYYKDKFYQNLLKNIPHISNVVTIWSCQWREDQQELPKRDRDYISERKEVYRKIKDGYGVHPRQAYMGGRTNNRRFYYDCIEGEEEIRMVDVVSLYPYVMHSREFPVGHPEVLRENFPPVEEIFGLVACRIRAPNQMVFPILPLRINGRLVFALCRSCAEQCYPGYCLHNDNDRDIFGCFFTPELHEALRKGYQMIQIYEAYHFPSKSDQIFKSYVDEGVAIKMESTGFPQNVEGDVEKEEKFVEDLFKETGIRLNRDKIRKNETRRTIAKLLLNSLYGKFGQDSNLPHFELVSDFNKLCRLMHDPEIEMLSDTNVCENKVYVSYKQKNPEKCSPGNTSVITAGFVTSYARLHLFRIMDELETRFPGSVLYFDTDSVAYVYPVGREDIPRGNRLGELDDVYKGKCYHAVFLGPKNYMLIITNPVTGDTTTVMKVKGITLTGQVLEKLTPETMKRMAESYLNHKEDTVMVPQTRFDVDNKHQLISNLSFEKKQRVCYTKRFVVPNLEKDSRSNDTLPFGYKRN